MSGVFGIFNRNGNPVDKKIANDMLETMSRWEPDESNLWIDGSIALGHTMLWNTPESKYEYLPLQKDTYIITMDARIDNREELVKELDLPERPMREIGDSEFILAAYQKWGEECPKHLLGDFAFAIWDNVKQQLFCARDHIGIKSFYYHIDKTKLIFANHIRGILTYPNIDQKIDDESVAIYLKIGELFHIRKTFYESISKLPPATTMIVTEDRMSQKTYWRPEDSPKITFENIDEYAETLRGILEDSVNKRLRSDFLVASHLSGGLDSSTISTIAARQLHLEGKKLQSYTWVPTPKVDDDIEHYEWSNSYTIAKNENIELTNIDLTSEKLCDILVNHDITMNDTVDLWYEFLVREEVNKISARTILSGWGGDELITHGAGAYYSELINDGKIMDVIRDIYIRSKKSKKVFRTFISMMYYKVFVPSVPESFYCFLPRISCDTRDHLKYATEKFTKKARNISIQQTDFKMKSLRQEQLDLFQQGHILNRIESWASSGFNDRIEYVYPLLDKRIVEFALGIPSDLYYQQCISRYIFRYAVEGWLPEKIRWGDYKYELHRVNKLYDIYEGAVKLWLNKTKNSKNFSSKYIELAKVEQFIYSLDKAELKNKNTFNELVDTIVPSILVVSLS